MALNLAFRTMSMPALEVFEILFPRGYKNVFHEDNQACIQCVKSGKNPSMRYIGRTHGISIVQLHENLGSKHENNPFDLEDTDTSRMAADIHTKGFTNAVRWQHAIQVINVVDPSKIKDRVKDHADHFALGRPCNPCFG